MFVGPKNHEKLDTKEVFKNLRSIRPQAMVDFRRGMLFKKLKEHVLFKRGDAWGTWPMIEILEHESFAIAMFTYHSSMQQEDNRPKIILPKEMAVHPQIQKENKNRAIRMGAALSASQGN